MSTTKDETLEIAIKRNDSWAILGKELKWRTVEPLFHVSYVLYFITGVVIFGGMGVWLELYSFAFPPPYETEPSAAALRTAILTFFPALAGTSCMQLIWEKDRYRALRAFAMAFFILLLTSALFIAAPTISTKVALGIGGVASCFALWLWWIANAEQQGLMDPDAPMGKKNPTDALAGSLAGFTT